MSIIVRFALFICSICTVSEVVAQTSTWPFAFQKPVCSTMPSAPSPVTIPSGNTCTKWPVVNNGAWDEPSTWNNGTLPANNDVVCIPAGVTVQVRKPTYTAATGCPSDPVASPQLFIFVCGTIDFKAGGKLQVGCNSNFQIYTGGGLIPANGNSDLIQVGTKVVWQDNNTTLNGPWYINDGCGSVPQGCQGAGVLPVEFGTLNASVKSQQQVELQWSTFQEINAASFMVERSTDGRTWQAVGKVLAKGSGQAITYYSFQDRNTPASLLFYRIKQLDADEKFQYSQIVKITVPGMNKGLAVYPNPVNNTATFFSQEGFKNAQSIQVFNAMGALVLTLPVQAGNRINYSLGGLLPGIYTVRLVEEGKTYAKTQLIKQ